MVELIDLEETIEAEFVEAENIEDENIEDPPVYSQNWPQWHLGICQDCKQITNNLEKCFMELPSSYEDDDYNYCKWVCTDGCYYTFPCGCVKRLQRDVLCGFIYKHRCVEHNQVLKLIPEFAYISTGENKQRWSGNTPETHYACQEMSYVEWKGEDYIVDV